MGRADHAEPERDFRSATLTGQSVLDDLGEDLDDLLRSTSAPITARRTWLTTWLRSFPDHEPFVVTVRSDARLDGAALLARRRRAGHTEIVPIGHGLSDALRLPARSARAAQALVDAIVDAIAGIRGAWRLVVPQLPVDDTVAAMLDHDLRHSEIESGVSCPVLRVTPGDSLEDHASTRYLREARRRRRVLEREGTVDVSFIGDADAIRSLLPELAAVRHRRDAVVARGKEFDQPSFLGFLEEVLVELARNDELEVAMLRVDGACAAYAVCLLDGSAVRQWHTSFDPAWSKLSPGTLITNATVERMLGDDRFTEYDFMRGVYDWKTELSNDLVPASCVLAWSSAPLRRAERALRSGRALLHSLPRR